MANLTSNHNVYFAGRPFGAFSWGSLSNGQFAQWQSAGGAPDSSNANPNLDNTFHLSSNSPATNVGINLSSLNIPNLNVGMPSVVGVNATNDGALRLSTSNSWPAGAFGNGRPLPAPPQKLTATVE